MAIRQVYLFIHIYRTVRLLHLGSDIQQQNIFCYIKKLEIYVQRKIFLYSFRNRAFKKQ